MRENSAGGRARSSRRNRPDETQRFGVLAEPLGQLGLSKPQIDAVVVATGAQNGAYGFTFSDLTQRLLPAIVLDAYPASAVNAARVLDITRRLVPTPPFQEGGS